MNQVLATISALLILAAAPPYIIDTVRGKTRPERMSWFIFSVLGVIAFVSQLKLGASWSLVFSGLDTLASILTFGLSLKYGVGGYTRLDLGALAVAAIGVVLAVVASQPLISLLGLILADGSGVLLTARKAFLQPASETAISWILVATASVLGAITVGRWSFALLLYPVYVAAACYAIPVAQLIGYKMGSRQKTV